jgi:hypothetical protein
VQNLRIPLKKSIFSIDLRLFKPVGWTAERQREGGSHLVRICANVGASKPLYDGLDGYLLFTKSVLRISGVKLFPSFSTVSRVAASFFGGFRTPAASGRGNIPRSKAGIRDSSHNQT